MQKRNMRCNSFLITPDLAANGRIEMRVKIQYLGLVKTYTNRTQDEIVLEEGTVLSDLFDRLASNLKKPFNSEVYDPTKKEVMSTFMVLVNGIVIGQLDGVNTKLKNGDTVVLMPLVTGG